MSTPIFHYQTPLVSLRQFEANSAKAYLEWLIREYGGNVTKAARETGTSRATLFHRIKREGVVYEKLPVGRPPRA